MSLTSRRAARPRRTIVLAVTSALVAALLVPFVTVRAAAPAAAAGPVSGAIGLGDGVSGSIDERTGMFSASVPLVNVGGPGSAGVTWSLVWEQGRAMDQLDRSGFGAGWSLGASFINPANPVTVYPANGGSYQAGGSYPSGLVNYPLQDVVYAKTSGAYAFTLTYDDGRVDGFDEHGNLVNRVDRFGNHTTLTWEQLRGDRWRPTTIVDGYGLTTTFTYTPSTVTVTAPARSDGVVAATTITLDDQQRVRSVKDPTGSTASFGYAPVSGSSADLELLTSAVSAAQARTTITYDDSQLQSGLTFVQSLITVDASDAVVGPARYFSLNPPENANDHNYTGNPDWLGNGTDRLFTSGSDYTYTTALSSCVVTRIPAPETCPGPALTTLSTYDSQHRLIDRTIKAGQVTVQHQTNGYVPVKASDLDPNYARPKTLAVTYSGTSDAGGIKATSGSRTASASRVYDNHGRVQSATDENGATTTTTYDSLYGLITKTAIVGADGSQSTIINGLSADHKTIHTSTTASAAPGQPLTARSTTTYEYDGQGQPATRTMVWAPGAKPTGYTSGPDTVTTTFASGIDTAARTRTLTTTTGVGTTSAANTTTVLDLVTGKTVRSVDGVGRATSYRYDASGRRTRTATPDGLVSTTSYTAAAGTTPATRTDSRPDGRVQLTTFDALGRTVRVTDNVHDQAFTSSPTSRQLAAYTYSLDGTKLTATDRSGRTIDTTLDALGRQVSQVGVTGITQGQALNDAAHTRTQTVSAAGSATAEMTRTSTYDNGNQPVTVQQQYRDGTADPTQAAAYDGIGRLTSQTSDDLTLGFTYLGAGGAPTERTATPQNVAEFPGDPASISTTYALGGQQTGSDREQSGAGAQGTTLTYDPIGRINTSTDPNGRTTTYTHNADGTVATRTTPSGTVITNTYDAGTGRLSMVTARPTSGPTITQTFGYIPAGQPGAGQVRTITDGASTVTLSYDADGHTVSRVYSDGTATSAKYLDNGQLTSTVDVTGAVTSYVPDSLGRVKTATQTRGTTTLASVTYTYDPMSRIATTTRVNGVTTTNAWTSHNQLSSQRTTTASGKLVEAHLYTYDTHGNVSVRIDTTAAGTWTTRYDYDAYDRLLGSAVYPGERGSGRPLTSTTYTLSTAGDVVGSTTRSSSPTSTTTTTNTIDAAGQLTTQTTNGTAVKQAFDGDGEVLTSLSGWAMTYDSFGRLFTASKAGTTSTYAYWADGTPRSTTTVAPSSSVCDQAMAQAGTGQGTYGRYQLVRAPAEGGSGSDVVVGTDGPDHLVGGSGNDVLCGLGGDDVLEGGSGNDYLDGGPGTDTLDGGTGNDTLVNGEVNDGGTGQTTFGASGSGTTVQTFHYGPDGSLANDTTSADTDGGAPATTASYLLTAGREARTLQPGTTNVGTVPAGAPAPETTGAGTGYLLRDRHSSVTALVDSTAAVTESYAYGDYGAAAAPNGQLLPVPPTAPDAGGRTNPFRYAGATPLSSRTDATTSLLLLPARGYDSAQGRFTSRDTANVFNHYQAFSTNPIINTDPTGHFSLVDLLIDIGVAIAFIVATVATAGAAAAALPAVVGMEAGALTASTIAYTAATAVGAVASATGAVTSVVKLADNIDDDVTGKHFLSKSGQQAVGTVETVAGVVAGVAGLGTLGATVAGAGADIAESAVQDASNFLESADDATAAARTAANRLALVEDETQDVGISSSSASQRVTPTTSSSLGPENPTLKSLTGDTALSDVDATMFEADRGVRASLEESESRVGDSSREADEADEPQIPNPFLKDAAEGDWDLDRPVDRGQSLYTEKSYFNERAAMFGEETDVGAINPRDPIINWDVLENPKK
jgi:RHS repeat-associated protein